MSERTFKGKVELGYVSEMAPNTEPITVPLMFRVGGANEQIGEAVVKVESGVLKIEGVNMNELGVRLLDLSMTLVTITGSSDKDDTNVVSIRNNRPRPTRVTLP